MSPTARSAPPRQPVSDTVGKRAARATPICALAATMVCSAARMSGRRSSSARGQAGGRRRRHRQGEQIARARSSGRAGRSAAPAAARAARAGAPASRRCTSASDSAPCAWCTSSSGREAGGGARARDVERLAPQPDRVVEHHDLRVERAQRRSRSARCRPPRVRPTTSRASCEPSRLARAASSARAKRPQKSSSNEVEATRRASLRSSGAVAAGARRGERAHA